MNDAVRKLPWLEPGDAFPLPSTAWGKSDPADGLLAAGGSLDVATLLDAYSCGIFPWFSDGQPILWWSPHPRMVLKTADFKLHRSLRKRLVQMLRLPGFAVKMDTAFEQVIQACSSKPRAGQSGTWIVPDMVNAYANLQRAGHAHSVEVWLGRELIGGLYCVNIGRMVFGESMFANRTDASKIALCALVSFCRAKDMAMIDCQQNTAHLASMGGAEINRSSFSAYLEKTVNLSPPTWQFQPAYWDYILRASEGTLT